MYASRWSSPEKASEFAQIYARSLSQRYKKLEEVSDPSSQSRTEDQDAKSEVLNGRHAWTTEEGAVIIEQQRDTVLVCESLDVSTTQAMEREVFGK
jgi:hypothetical protein